MLHDNAPRHREAFRCLRRAEVVPLVLPCDGLFGVGTDNCSAWVPTSRQHSSSYYPLPAIMVQAVTDAAAVQNMMTSAVCQRFSGL